jgi:hypothetical protein
LEGCGGISGPGNREGLMHTPHEDRSIRNRGSKQYLGVRHQSLDGCRPPRACLVRGSAPVHPHRRPESATAPPGDLDLKRLVCLAGGGAFFFGTGPWLRRHYISAPWNSIVLHDCCILGHAADSSAIGLYRYLVPFILALSWILHALALWTIEVLTSSIMPSCSAYAELRYG